MAATQADIGRIFDAKGKLDTDAAYARFVFATGQSSGVGHNIYFKDFVAAVRANPSWGARHRTTIATTDLVVTFTGDETPVNFEVWGAVLGFIWLFWPLS